MGAWIEMIGLKYITDWEIKSHPLWVRGLKYLLNYHKSRILLVAPFMGAWIEILMLVLSDTYQLCRTLYGCVD